MSHDMPLYKCYNACGYRWSELHDDVIQAIVPACLVAFL